MQRSPRPARTPSSLSGSVHHQLNMYSLAASAAGVSLLALVQPAEARIRYTKAHHVIGRNSSFQLDLNHDGRADFTIGYRFHSATSSDQYLIYGSGVSGNGIEGSTVQYKFFAAALKRGTRIPNRLGFFSWARMAYQSYHGPDSTHSGNWINVTNRYLGLKFKIHGKTHYGWARLSVQDFVVTLTGYAYETIPNKPIIAGKTKGRDDASVEESNATPSPTRKLASLGLLALGSSGLSIWRREESMNVAQ
jgi:hypothetical protein